MWWSLRHDEAGIAPSPSPIRRWIVVPAVVLAAAWVIAPASVPLYDSCCVPDEAYRYVDPPAGYRHTPAPSTGSATVRLVRGRTPAQYINTTEIGPQADFYLPSGAVAVSRPVRRVTVRVTPVAAPPLAPMNGEVTGNVYRLTAVADTGRNIGLRPGSTAELQLRAPSSRQPGPVLEHYDGNGWQPAPRTLRTGSDVYQAHIDALGDWALVLRPAGTSGATGDGLNVGLLAAGIAVLSVAGTVLLVRRRRRDAPAEQ